MTLALTLILSASALHFIYGALDTRYQRFWGLDRVASGPAVPPAPGGGSDQLAFDPLAETRRLAGQLVMVGFSGTSLDSRSGAPLRDAIRRGLAGGVLLFERNISSPSQIKALTAALQAARPAGHPPLLIAVDQEGGQVQRFTRANGHAAVTVPSAKTVARRCTAAEAGKLYFAVACRLREAGITLNLGPVADIDSAGGKNPIIGGRERSFGREASRVTEYGAAFIAAHARAGVATAVKHFPGHGSSVTDSHLGFTDITASFKTDEFEPFRALAGRSAGQPADIVMTGHLHHAAYSRDGEPATFSRALLIDELRKRMGFSGVVMSDDLEMGAIRDRYPLGEAAVRAVNAGVDMVIVSNTGVRNPKIAEVIHGTLAAAIRQDCADGTHASCIPADRIREAHARVVALKEKLAAHTDEPSVPACSSAQENALEKVCTGEEQVAGWWQWLFW